MIKRIKRIDRKDKNSIFAFFIPKWSKIKDFAENRKISAKKIKKSINSSC